MLKTLDLLIGLSVVMLMASLGVTLLTQSLINLRQSRGKHLLRGIADLLELIHPTIKRDAAEKIATCVLQHPLIRGSKRRLGDVIKREELTKMLLGLADPNVSSSLAPEAKAALTEALSSNGIADPDKILSEVRMLALRLEQSHPELSNTARQNFALIEKAGGEFVGKMNAWFDQTMDRVTERFTHSTRILTFLSSIVIAGALQLDTVQLVNRLSMDEQMLKALVEEGVRQTNIAAAAAGPGPDTERTHEFYSFLGKAGVVNVAAGFGQWKDNWSRVNPAGFALSVLLLSLGGPFWYSMLSRMLQLRSVLARQDDAERVVRQTQQPPPRITAEVTTGP